MSLTRQDVIQAGVEILDAYGLGDLSMRRLGERLGVKAGALYWHVANKQTLLAAVSDAILGGPEGPTTVPARDAELGDGVVTWAQTFRHTLLRHRDAAELVASTISVGLGQVDPAVGLRSFLVGHGFDADRATSLARALVHLVLGHAMEEQTRSQLHELGILAEIQPEREDADFALAVEVFVAGMATLAP